MASIPPTTNPTPEEILYTFHNLGARPLQPSLIGSTILRVLVARGLYLGGHITSPEEQDEFDLIDQELANRMMGRDTALK
jgi:hypothetical protein